MTAIALGLVVVSAVLWLAAPLIIRFYLLLSPGATGGPYNALATRLLRYFAPQGSSSSARRWPPPPCSNARRRFTARPPYPRSSTT